MPGHVSLPAKILHKAHGAALLGLPKMRSSELYLTERRDNNDDGWIPPAQRAAAPEKKQVLIFRQLFNLYNTRVWVAYFINKDLI